MNRYEPVIKIAPRVKFPINEALIERQQKAREALGDNTIKPDRKSDADTGH